MPDDKNQLTFDFIKGHEPLRYWPDNKYFPLNLKDYKRTVENIILEDISHSSKFIILTGFTSLSYLIDTFGNRDYPQLSDVRIVLGFEPNTKGRKRYHQKPLDQEIKDYWLKEELSILLGGSIINLIEKIKSGKITFKFKDKLHAKVYVGDHAAILGSSNFSFNGLRFQSEANIRLTKSSHNNLYKDILSIANNFYNDALPYDNIIKLLTALIRRVTWQEALARAIAEVIEGNWLQEYSELFNKLRKTNLWPTQWTGLAQAMNILQNNGNVLIADPTGSGKTKLCAAIILTLKHWLWENGRHFKDDSVIVCPPLVMNKWGREFRELSSNSDVRVSMGILSRSDSEENKKIAMEELDLANILAVDEAHNYLNVETKRSISVRLNNADYKLLITATPISKKADDVLRLIELLDLDNLDDKSFDFYEELISHPHLQNEKNLKLFKQFISKFTVRRTKSHINRLIQKDKGAYTNKLGQICKFPTQIPVFYPTIETEEDKKIVLKINSLIKKLKGITYLRSLKKPTFDLYSQDRIQEYVDNRFNSSKALAKFYVRANLRSSHVALYEHIFGTDKAKQQFEFKTSKQNNKARVQSLKDMVAKNKAPRIDEIFKDAEIADWFINKERFIEACRDEIKVYEQIATLALKLSGERELGKVKLLIEASRRHDKLVAFDSTIVTLDYFHHLMRTNFPESQVLLATGSDRDGSSKVLSKFQLTSEDDERIIALCSDKMSEGVDLQRASAVVLLDMPSVLRIVEQRLGRVDRMDSYFEEIETFWPDDSDEYSLKGDQRLVEINEFVRGTIGSNVEMPRELSNKHFSKTNSIQDMVAEIKEYMENDKSWEEVNNSFQPVFDLKEGPKAIIDEEAYDAIKNTKVTIKTRVSFLNSKTEWCFFALRGGERKTPRWIFFEADGSKYRIYTDFPEICEKIREHTYGVSESKKWNDQYLQKFVNLLYQKEIELLPPKKKRALQVAEELLKKKLRAHKTDRLVKESIKNHLKIFNNQTEAIDVETYAELWIQLLQPHLEQRRKRNKVKRKVFNLNSLLRGQAPSFIEFKAQELDEIYDKCPISNNINSKIASCIVGIPGLV